MIKVLVLEDDKGIQNVYRRLLNELRCDFKIVSCPKDAMTMLEDEDEWHPHIIFSDWDMPGANGGDFCRSYQERHTNSVPIIIVSGMPRTEPRAVAILSKPFTNDDIRLAIEQHVPS